jgi:hypothetical protein
MWRPKLWLSLLLLFFSLSLSGLYQAQEAGETQPERLRYVGIMGGRFLGTAAPSDLGDDGTSRLSELFRSLGALVYTITPEEAIPSEIELLVIIRPRRSMSTLQTAYIWDFVQKGGHLLLAVDPIGHNQSNPEVARNSGLNRLLRTEFGISLADDFLIEEWFGLENLNSLVSSWSEARAEDLVPHTITEPLIHYDLPIRFWGARSVFVDSVTGISDSNALIYVEKPYGETTVIDYRNTETEQFILNIGSDSQGRLLLASIGTNRATGSRVAILGDSEIFQNLYGQTRMPQDSNLPLFPGDFIFTQRLLAWLLAVPPEDWPELPQGFTWISMDGEASDWPHTVPVLPDTQSTTPFYSLSQVRAFRNDQFVYLLLETLNPVPEGVEVFLMLDNGAGETLVMQANPEGLVSLQGALVGDAAVAFGQGVEIRIPRRVFGSNNTLISQACILLSETSQSDCYEGSIEPSISNNFEPVPNRFGAGPQIFLTADANIRTEPSLDSQVIALLPIRSSLAAFGRTSDNNWIFARNGRYEGWISAQLLEVNADLKHLPVLVEVEIEAEASPEATAEVTAEATIETTQLELSPTAISIGGSLEATAEATPEVTEIP